MNTTAALNEIAAILRRIEEAAYERGKVDAKKDLLAYLSTEDPSVKAGEQKDAPRPRHRSVARTRLPAQARQRAPKGAVPDLICRALLIESGLTPREILERAETDFQKMIKLASIRGELRVGALLGKYVSNEGRWSLTSHPKEETEGHASQPGPSASHHNQGGPHGTALDR